MSTTGQKIDPNGVNHPRHYNEHPSGVEAIVVCREMSFNVGNAFKYVYRLGAKDRALKELEKALWYLKDEDSNFERLADSLECCPSDYAADGMTKIAQKEPNLTTQQFYGCLYRYWCTRSRRELKNAQTMLVQLIAQHKAAAA